MFPLDFIQNGQGHGTVAQRLLATNLDPGALRPWVGPDGRTYITLNVGYKPDGTPKYQSFVTNTPGTLTKEAWLRLDEAIIRAARPQLRVWGDIVSAGLTYNLPNAMGTPVIQYQTMTDAGNAAISMDALREAERDRPTFDIANHPIPIIHSDFSFSLRELLISRQSNAPLDTTMGEQSARKIAEQAEKLMLGTTASYSYGGGTIYGMTNHPDRVTKSMTLPTDPGWDPATFVDEILDGLQSLRNIYFNGPYGVFYSPSWAKYLDSDYSATYAGATLRTRLAQLSNISWWRESQYLTGYQVLVVQLTSDVIRAIQGMGITTLQWESHGGLQVNFKVMAIMVPQIRSNSDGNTGILHGTAA